MPVPDKPGWSECRECRGTGYVAQSRAYMDRRGEVSTVIAEARCLHCRPHPGQQPGDGNTPPA